MPRAQVSGIELEYETFGDPANPPLVLVMGLGAQLVDWPLGFAHQIADSGFHVIRFDNRDAGLSTWFDDQPLPDIAALRSGTATPPYTLTEMADDLAGLLDALGIDAAHVVGASMGGMIVQRFAINHPRRVLTMTSIMSTTGAPGVGGATPEAQAVLVRPPAPNREAAIESGIAAARVIGSTGFTVTDEYLRNRITVAYDRGYHPAGSMRQLAAIVADGDRTEGLRGVTVPTMVIHGSADPLINVSGGEATAAAVPGAELLVVAGMGHDLPEGAWPEIVDAIVRTAKRAG
jgi:pimeloyl-ACP methyl ester carboxylesterase